MIDLLTHLKAIIFWSSAIMQFDPWMSQMPHTTIKSTDLQADQGDYRVAVSRSSTVTDYCVSTRRTHGGHIHQYKLVQTSQLDETQE